ncbi:IS1595 family transposase [Caulobacter segnis]|uniref:IS1595 family transposase n=1 Tax=Caulobacter segnis TaxID=88688 RepID=UPI0028644D6B|nr:IS1595 family transposase [Caulobacter segnis]MDR6623946.1 transposase-like protein [Caulobacter segnis]
MSKISAIKGVIARLPVSDILDISSFIANHVQNQAVQVALTKRSQTMRCSACIQCGFACLVQWGRANSGTQRFKCRNCKATFGATTGTPLYRLRNRHLWAKYLGLMTTHIPLVKLREQHGIDLSLPTLHRWRHRFLTALIANPAQKLAGLIEADEKFFRTSFKGSRGWKRGARPQDRKMRRRGGADQRGFGDQQVPVLTALDRSGTIFQTQLPDTRWDSIGGAMKPWVEAESMICSDGNGAYARVAGQTGCEHMVVKKGSGGGNTRNLSIGRIDAYHRDVENLVNRRCMGVGTRYLMNYFGWARRITQHKPFGNDLLGEILAAY